MAEGMVEMSRRERERMRVLDQVRAGGISLKEAALRMKVCYRQAKRLSARYRERGAAGLTHRGRGRAGHRRRAGAEREQALGWVERRYADFGPTLAAEKLSEEHGLTLDHETLRRWMIERGLWTPRGPGRKHRRRRPRRARFGELVQMDGSHHDWFEGRRGPACLMVIIDDARGVRQALFDEEETTEAAMRLLKAWIERFGVPEAIYVDGKSTFITEREPTAAERARGETPMTVWGQSCAKLGIEIIRAHSPQAKGRVERANGVFQDRLVKDMRLAGIDTIEAANAFLPGWLDRLNERLSVEATDPVDAHRVVGDRDLDAIFAWDEPRTVHNDLTVRHQNRWYQIEPDEHAPRPGQRVVVRRKLNGVLELVLRDRSLEFKPLGAPPPGAARKPRPVKPRRRCKPSPDHPWRRRAIGKSGR